MKQEQRDNLIKYLDDYPGLKALYDAKQNLMRYLLLKTLNAKRMQRKLLGFLELIEHLHQSPLRALVKMLESWLEPIRRHVAFQ